MLDAGQRSEPACQRLSTVLGRDIEPSSDVRSIGSDRDRLVVGAYYLSLLEPGFRLRAGLTALVLAAHGTMLDWILKKMQ